jgi:hypothetical protein
VFLIEFDLTERNATFLEYGGVSRKYNSFGLQSNQGEIKAGASIQPY